MKSAIAALTCQMVLWAKISAWAQGTFQNLDFESALIVPAGDPFVQFAPAFPGWTGQLGTNEQSVALFNTLSIGTAAIALLGPGWTHGGIIAGSYTAVLQAGSYPPGALTPADAAIFQSGLIPAGTRSIRLLSSGARNGITVSLNGNQIAMVIIGTQGGFNIYGGDVSQFGGMTEELRIAAISAPSSPANLYLDSIEFSTSTIPEPSAAALVLLGLFGFALLLRRPRIQMLQLPMQPKPTVQVSVLTIDTEQSRGYPLRVPRKLRIEYPGAIYHLLNRGDQHENILKDASTATLVSIERTDTCMTLALSFT